MRSSAREASPAYQKQLEREKRLYAEQQRRSREIDRTKASGSASTMFWLVAITAGFGALTVHQLNKKDVRDASR